MNNEKWFSLKEIDYSFQIWSGAVVRVYEGSEYEENYLDYIVSFIYDNIDYLQLTCLSKGEEGNIVCVLKKVVGEHYVLGEELKKMMDYENQVVLVNCHPDIQIN
ncbi:hypothetical protein [Listeria booriae]|uniref:hypothetical protein n=1 Tax=Listeria booriae TaxID=1552123 RepID=UPI001C8994A3|nr:hypothetical protein [Listeria booriae]